MDSITHIALGACVGDTLLGKQLSKKAMLFGAIANSIPDIDIISRLWLSSDAALLAHRGFTHSILFATIFTFFLALLFKQWFQKKKITLKRWMIFFAIQLFLHLFIDAFNSYGIGWFEPFSHYRISFNTIFVLDPFFSIWMLIAFIMLLILKKTSTKRKFWQCFGLGISSIYLVYCVSNKLKIERDVKDIFYTQKINYNTYFTTPTPLNNWLWYIVASNNSGYYIGYRSLFDSKKNIDFHFFPRNDSLLLPIRDHEEEQHLIRFSRGFYTIEKYDSVLIFNELHFGQIAGWKNPNAIFVFHYYLEHYANNNLVVQRGRFVGWDWDAVKSLINRIKGN